MSPHAKHHQSFFACSNATPHCRRSFFIMKHTEKPAHTLLRKVPPTRLAVHHPGPPHASHAPRKQGARHWGPYVLMPLVLSMHLGSIHHICTPPLLLPWSPSCPYKGSKPKKRKGRKGEKNTAATMQNSAGRSTVYCPGPCLSSPGLS